MKYRNLDTVILERDLPEQGLRRGDLGAVVQTLPPDALDVEFVTAAGRTAALVTLRVDEVRLATDRDQLAVRPIPHSA